MRQKIVKSENIRDNIDLNSEINNFACSRIGETPTNILFEHFWKTHSASMEREIQIIASQLEIENLIPAQGQVANVVHWHKFLLVIIHTMPEPLKKQCLENYHQFKLIEYGDI